MFDYADYINYHKCSWRRAKNRRKNTPDLFVNGFLVASYCNAVRCRQEDDHA